MSAASTTPVEELAGWRYPRSHPSLPESHHTIHVPRGVSFWRKALAFAGPGYMVAVGYMDPGNWATDLAGGARFGYTLLSVILISNLMAILLQALALKLGIVTGRDLAQACRDHYSRPVSFVLWVLCEIAIAACDLAEVIGSAIALNLLFGIPLIWGVCLTAFDVLLILLLQHKGFRYLEALVIALVVTIGVCFGIELFMAQPAIGAILGGLVPRTEVVTNPAMLYIAIGILGATVMPHNLYLHSSIVQTRKVLPDDGSRREAIRFATLDSTVALLFAFFINGAILILAAATFNQTGHQEVADIGDAYRLLTPLLGTTFASTLFAVALLASGQNSTITGTLAGQIVMEGFLDIRLPAWLRRLITRLIAIIPAVIVTALYGEHGAGSLLILSQVILSLQLSFAVIPLVYFTSQRRKMGVFVNSPLLAGTAWAVALVILALNGWLLIGTFREWLGVTPLRAAAVWLAVAAAPIAAQQDETPGPIADNSFLIEEAFNQERGVVQHISTFARPDGGGAWAYSFTQEWPLSGMRHQLSYTVPVQHDEVAGTGIGDIGLNYRYQLVGIDGGSIYVAPRVSLLLPTGSEFKGRGAGGAGFQANLPVSLTPTPSLAFHGNAGATWTPSAKSPLGAESATLSANAGGSVVWLVRPSFNFLVELLWYDTESVVAQDATVRGDTWLLNPGVRWAFNFPSGLQIVPGVAYTVGLSEGDGNDGLFLYLSFEHPFKRYPSESP